MIHATARLRDLLPARTPSDPAKRLLLYALRRMGAHGLNDAHAANAMLGRFGIGYRRPLILLRAMVLELARASNRRIAIAGCCCRRMTGDEATIITTIAVSLCDPHGAHAGFAALLASENSLGAVITAQALAQAFADLGSPLDAVAQG